MNDSRRSTFTGRSMIGQMRLMPGPRTRLSFGLAQPEDDQRLVLLDDADGQVEEDGQEPDADRDQDDGREEWLHEDSLL